MNELEQALRSGSLPAGDAGAAAAAGRLIARAEEEGLLEVAYGSVDSPFGELFAAATPRGLLRLSYDTTRNDGLLAEIAEKVSPRVLEAPARLDPVRRQLAEYFDGRRRRFDLKLDWSLTRGFFQKVLRETARLGYGELATYRQMAEAAGSPRATRAAGNALGSNPIPIVVPCHRIIRTGGKMGGYGGSLGPYIGGPGIKQRLLELEGALDEQGRPRLG
ncbi:MAG: methylated-DNA-[protein]-cysteine S-methyltransferase [Thermoleophilaceae bacterium]|jgi:methylated-DNA-[protein]-cysteine S-methyltransferase|nr:methylated-DNA-[protein]-cysteine S-methyltransferase [Thermoleophilaceae bacterium]